MSTEIEIKLVLPNAATIERILDDEFVLRYVKDEFISVEMHSAYYDTADWILAQKDYMLRVRTVNGTQIATLKHGSIDPAQHPGLFHCRQWKCRFMESDELVSALIARGAPQEIEELLKGKQLVQAFHSDYRRRHATLYLPDMLRAELSLDRGTLNAEEKSEPLYELGLELLYGKSEDMTAYCEQLMHHFSISPALLTKQQRALRLIRSR